MIKIIIKYIMVLMKRKKRFWLGNGIENEIEKYIIYIFNS